MERNFESHDRLLSIFHNAPIAIALCDTQGRFIIVNKEFEMMFGYVQLELELMTFYDLTYEEDISKSIQEMQKIYGKKIVNSQFEKRYRSKNGELIWGRTVISAVNNAEGKLVQTFAMVNNISLTKATQNQLKKMEKQHNELVELLFNGIMIVDHTHPNKKIIIDANLSLSSIFGYNTVNEILGKNLGEFLSPESMEKISTIRDKRLFGKSFQMTGQTLDGQEVILDFLSKEIEIGNRTACIIAIRDKTDEIQTQRLLQESQEQLYHIQKMEAIGRLAVGIAHDFNNILTIISGYSNLLEELEGDNSGKKERSSILFEINEAVERGSNLTEQLLDLARNSKNKSKLVDLNETISNLVRMFTRLRSKKVDFTMDLDNQIAPILFDNTLFEQVIMNLLVNAMDAIDGRGIIEISSRLKLIDHNNQTSFSSKVKFIEIEVSDNGSGIEASQISQIFDPFFTTKIDRGGSGLGLSVVHEILKKYGAEITVNSSIGRGTTFKIIMPYRPFLH